MKYEPGPIPSELENLPQYLSDELRRIANLQSEFDEAESNTPLTITAATATINSNTNWYIIDRAGTCTLTLPSPFVSVGRKLHIKTIQAQAVNSASSNVCPVTSNTPGTAIVPAVDGSWATLYSDGTNWVIMQKG